MRILHVITGVYKGGGGTSEVVPRLARALHVLGHEVTIAALTLESDISDEMQVAKEAGVKYQGMDEDASIFPKAIGFSRGFIRKIEPLIQDADIIHLHGLWMYPPWAAGWLAQKYHKPYVMMTHGFLEPARLQISKWKKRIVGALIERPLLRHANAIVATAESEADGIRKYGLTNRIHIMPIGLDLELFKIKADSTYTETRCKTLLFFSRITPIKGLDLLADAWSRVKSENWKLLIVGPDDRGYRAEMESVYAAKCQSGTYEFRDPVYGQAKYELLSHADAFILPTRSENWSIAVAEAMASGLPVICTKGAPWSCLTAIKAGWWCDISVEGLERSLRELVACSDMQLRVMGSNGRHWVKQNLTWPKIAAEMCQLYDELIEEVR